MTPPRHRTQSDDKLRVWAVCGFLLLAVSLIYGRTLGYEFLNYDDPDFVANNPHVRAGLTVDGVKWAFTDGPYGERFPLAMISHMLDCQVFGLSPWGHHLTNLLLHSATAISLFLVWRQMTGDLWASACVATLFAVHPQRVESVAWISERRDVLSGFFFMLCLGAYLGYVRRGRSIRSYLLVALLFACALLSKATVTTLPALLLLLDFWPLRRFGRASETAQSGPAFAPSRLRTLVLEKLPLLAMAVAYGLLTLGTHAGAKVFAAPWPVRFGNAAVAYIAYVADLFCPVGLTIHYPLRLAGLPAWEVVGAAAILLAVSIAALAWRRQCPYLFVGWYWYVGMLLPMAGLVSIGIMSRADRYTYLPSVGLFVTLAWGARRILVEVPRGRVILSAFAALVIGILMACAFRQASFWRDDETLWTHALACTTDNSEAEFGISEVLRRRNDFDSAIPHYRRAIELGTDANAFNGLGLTLAQTGRASEAIPLFRKALELDPDSTSAHLNLGWALLVTNQLEDSRREFERVLEIDDSVAAAHCGQAYLLRRQGDAAAARRQFEQAIELDPQKAAIHVDLASLLNEQGNIESAISHWQAALDIDPRLVAVHVNLARALAASGRTTDAADHYRQAIQLNPQNPVPRQELDRLAR